ncbi:DUF420 domain-containing protein [Natronorubrum daqingense]|uniref:Putative membrane protein n=1 Tax=Natronorubrum daqingense TaxID=588898 RepID=A0A1N6YI61_9EURY|nr:DUF420 domain-containing protein [Natronorubrum daqingense]APX95659.1 hypothetical protein BB347_02975 [Natronorubrum daqingense]SIR14258.1 putative membrane protein [Natronorubrum daqingense]
MATASARRRLREQPIGATIALTIVGYALVFGTFLLDLPIYPDLTPDQVTMFTHAIAVINAVTTVFIVAGWYWIRVGEVEKHRKAMISAFAFIVLFLVTYLTRVGGGDGEKQIVAPALETLAYQIMLGIHIILSIVAVPVVLYALILGLTHTPSELRNTSHAKIGRIAAASWVVSLVLGVVTYLLLNHVYTYEFAIVVAPLI